MASFGHRIGYFVTCAIPAHLLSPVSVDERADGDCYEQVSPSSLDEHDELDTFSLRNDASANGLSFVQVQRQQDANSYWARVAASKESVRTTGYTVLLSEEDLSFALPYDKRLEGQTAERILELLHAHAAAMRPAPARAPRVPVATFEADAAIGVFELPVAEVSEQYAQMSGGTHERSVQCVLLHLALAAVEQMLARGGQEATEALQERAARLTALQAEPSHTSKRVVRSTIVRRGKREVWQVQFAQVA